MCRAHASITNPMTSRGRRERWCGWLGFGRCLYVDATPQKTMSTTRNNVHVGTAREQPHTNPLQSRYAMTFPLLVFRRAQPCCSHPAHSAFRFACHQPTWRSPHRRRRRQVPPTGGGRSRRRSRSLRGGAAGKSVNGAEVPSYSHDRCASGHPIRKSDTRSTITATVPMDPRDSHQPGRTPTPVAAPPPRHRTAATRPPAYRRVTPSPSIGGRKPLGTAERAGGERQTSRRRALFR